MLSHLGSPGGFVVVASEEIGDPRFPKLLLNTYNPPLGGLLGLVPQGGIGCDPRKRLVRAMTVFLAHPATDDGAGAADPSPAVDVHPVALRKFAFDVLQDQLHVINRRYVPIANRHLAIVDVESAVRAELEDDVGVGTKSIRGFREIDKRSNSCVEQGVEAAERLYIAM